MKDEGLVGADIGVPVADRIEHPFVRITYAESVPVFAPVPSSGNSSFSPESIWLTAA